ncbi:acyl-CoA carboxylase subunit beta [candidate division WOR-3 bacterium]|nr:acyl-CoA carboxylase subunit beta [candidate division WOR-3 bacterium]
MDIKSAIADFIVRVQRWKSGGGAKSIEKQKQRGKLTARERIEALLDENSFFETDLFVEHKARGYGLEGVMLAGDGVITGIGKISGRPVALFAQDFTVAGGSLGEGHASKISKVMDMAKDSGIPLIGLNDSGGARIQEGVGALAGYGEIFYRNTKLSGVIPQISLILGPCAGGAVYSPALTDFVIVVEKISNMFITGPEVIKAVIGEEISMEDLGGALTHAEITGNAHFVASSEKEAFRLIQKLLSYIPSNNREQPPLVPPENPKKQFDITNIIPSDPKITYDMLEIISSITDGSKFIEVHRNWAKNIVVGFGRVGGHSIGIVANQPYYLAGVLDVNAADKAARFIRFCDSFNIPLVTFVDIPGYLPGVDQEHAGVIRHGAKVLYAFSEATVPKLTVIVRKAYGGGYIAMCSKHLGADFVAAWPTAEIAVMGPEGAANILFRKEIMESPDPEKTRKEKITEYQEKFANPYIAASKGFVDAVIEPEQTRQILIDMLNVYRDKSRQSLWKHHGNIPL